MTESAPGKSKTEGRKWLTQEDIIRLYPPHLTEFKHDIIAMASVDESGLLLYVVPGTTKRLVAI